MAKHLALIALLFLIPALAKADSFVSVVVQPNQVANFHPGDNILQISFVWNTTDGILSDFDLVTSPGAPPNFPAITPISFSAPSGKQQIQGSEIFNITLAVAPNALFTLEERAHNDDNGILSTPGTRQGLETLYVCDHCDGRDGSASLQIWGQATSTVTSFGDDPVSTTRLATFAGRGISRTGIGGFIYEIALCVHSINLSAAFYSRAGKGGYCLDISGQCD